MKSEKKPPIKASAQHSQMAYLIQAPNGQKQTYQQKSPMTFQSLGFFI